jgi:hypothetical protein
MRWLPACSSKVCNETQLNINNEDSMSTGTLQGLVERIRGGDTAAAQQLHRALKPVVSRDVRRILKAEEYSSPLGQRVRRLLAEADMRGFSDPSEDLEPTVRAVAQQICGQTMARLTSLEWVDRSAAETLCW